MNDAACLETLMTGLEWEIGLFVDREDYAEICAAEKLQHVSLISLMLFSRIVVQVQQSYLPFFSSSCRAVDASSILTGHYSVRDKQG